MNDIAETEVRRDFVAYLHRAARDTLVSKIEAMHDPKELGQPAMSLCVAVVTSATSYIECMINEYWNSILNNGRYSWGVEDLVKRRFRSVADAMDWKRKHAILEKYELAVSLSDKAPLDKGALPYQDAETLIALRNELVHYEPRSIEYEKGERTTAISKLEKRLASRVSIGKERSERAPFPHKYLNAQCARWSAEASQTFVDTFLDRVGAPKKQFVMSLDANFESPPNNAFNTDA